MDHIYTQLRFGENWFGYEELYRLFISEAPQKAKIVEVGCWKGKSISFLGVEAVNSGKDISIFGVDTWMGSGSIHSSDPYIQNNTLYDLFLENIQSLRSVVTPIRMPSVEAAKLFEDGSLHAVFIDADHEYDSVKADIASWLPKVRPGGLIAGHDYDSRPETGHPGVRRAVHEAFPGGVATYPANCWLYRKSL